MNCSITIMFLLAVSLTTAAQHQQQQLFAYNVGFGALTGGIGAIINKPKTTNWKPAFLKGCWQGALGGTLTFAGKKSLYLVKRNKTLVWAWPAKIIHSAGTSIIENAAAAEPFLENWNINLGPVRFDFSFNAQRSFKARLLPFSLYSITAGFVVGKPDLATSLQTGNLAFVKKETSSSTQQGNSGISLGRAFAYENSSDRYHFIAHEIVHQFQFDEYQSINSWLLPLSNQVKSRQVKNLFSKFFYFDIPYFWISYYGIERTHNFPHYYRNFYEFEAESFSTNKFVQK